VREFLRNLFVRPGSAGHRRETIGAINARRLELRPQSDAVLRTTAKNAETLLETVAVAAVAAERLLGLELFDVQLQGALALAGGRIAEMQTGEGKTLAAVPAIAWHAKAGQGVHVMTVNDYLARRDAQWMGPIYEVFGLSVGCIQQGMNAEERKRAYNCDITYATANEIGFDFLRDQIALYPAEQVHRPFASAVIDEADSILIDEARIPLVLAGGPGDAPLPAWQGVRSGSVWAECFADRRGDSHGGESVWVRESLFRGESAAVRGGSGFAACAWAAAAGCRLPGEERFNRICGRVQGAHCSG
jgi:hypothetical protein